MCSNKLKVFLVMGDKDELISKENLTEAKYVLEKSNIDFSLISFEGGQIHH